MKQTSSTRRRSAPRAGTRAAVLEAAIREHRVAVRRIFGVGYGSPTGDGTRSADADLWAVLEDE